MIVTLVDARETVTLRLAVTELRSASPAQLAVHATGPPTVGTSLNENLPVELGFT